MNLPPNLFIIPSVIVMALLIVAAVVGLIVRRVWKPLEAFFPAQQPMEPSIGRRYQSFKIGNVNLGFSIHVRIDDNYLHLRPAWTVNWFGLKPVSIPWDSIHAVPNSVLKQHKTKVKIRKQTITGPKWCFGLGMQSPQTI